MKTITFFIILSCIFIISQADAQENLTAEMLWKMGRVSDIQVSPDNNFVLYGVTWYNLEENKGQRDLYKIPVEGGEAINLTNSPKGEHNGLWRPDGEKIGYLSAEGGTMQIWEMNPDGSDKKQVSDIEGGVSGFSYSPTLAHILYTKNVKLDQTPNELYPDLPDVNVRIIDDMMYRHWNSWHDYAYSHLFVAPYNAKGDMEEGIDIMEGEHFDTPMNPWGGMEQICWSPDGKKIAYTCKKSEGLEYTLSTNSEIYLYDLSTQKTNNLSKGNLGYDHDPVFSPDGEKIVWKSMETPGYEADKERIMMLDFTKEQRDVLTDQFDQNATHYIWSEDGKKLYFISGTEATYQIYFIDPDSKKLGQITSGIHNYTSFALAGDYIIGTRMSMSSPVEVFKIDSDGKEEQLTHTNSQLLSEINLAKMEKRWIPTTDGKKMLTWVIYPPNFDKNKQYPALLYCQGGPQSAVSQFWSFRWNFQMMAAHGYIIVAPNRRGLPTFGQEWNAQISGDYGGQNMEDYLSAIDSLSKEPFIDSDRLGSIGASYGGYSVLWLAGNHNKRFKAFISHCGMFNLESQYASTEEYFFVNYDLEGPFWEDPKPKSYEFSPHKFVANWDTPIMLITGQYDLRIPYTESLQAFNSARLRGIPSRLLFFPDESHFVLQPQNAVLWQREFFRWLDTYLK